MAGVAGVLRDELQPLCVRVDAAVLTAVPALAEDADVRVALARSTGANLADVLALLADPGLPVDSGVPPEALALATTLVRRGVEPGDLVQRVPRRTERALAGVDGGGRRAVGVRGPS